MELHDVEVVGAHPLEALLDAGTHVVPGEDVLAEAAGTAVRAHGAAALAGQGELVPPV